MSVPHLDSPQNPTIKSVARLRTRRGREQQGRIVIDGLKEVRRAIEYGTKLETILVYEGEATDWTQAAKCVYTVSERAFEKIAFGHRREIVAVAQTPRRILQDLVVPPLGSIAVLDRLEKPGNVGAVIRSADGAGMDAVILVDPVTDLFNPNAIRASVGTIFSQQVATASFDEYVRWAIARGLHHFIARCDADAVPFDHAELVGNAIVLGSEATGVGERWSALPQTSITIPMAGFADSLNVSAAAAILFYQTRRGGWRADERDSAGP